MYIVRLAFPADFEGWRSAARHFLMANVAPCDISWRIGDDDKGLFDTETPYPPLPDNAQKAVVSSQFIALAQKLICHSDPSRFDLAYRLLRRLKAEPHLLAIRSDPDVHRAHQLERAVARDKHKMKAFVRFRKTGDEIGPIYLSWFEPSHHVLDAVAPFFMRRFTNERWAILTPGRSAHWDGTELIVKPSEVTKRDIPRTDALEDYWRTYFASIFNPARLKISAMQSEMPKKYWEHLPEARIIAPLIAGARKQTEEMIVNAPSPMSETAARIKMKKQSHDEPETAPITLERLKAQAKTCQACPLWEPATQTVFGEGPDDARMMLVGEQPGDSEDLAGRPFVGPAGALLDRALSEAGIDRAAIYVTNAVKHFKFRPVGKRRLHQSPNKSEIQICRRWLEEEQRLISPNVIVALGATAAQSVLNRPVKLMRERGEPIAGENDVTILLTVHPSYLLRLPDAGARADQYAAFVLDLKQAASLIAAA